MISSGLFRRLCAVALSAALITTLAPAPARAGESLGTVDGRVFATDAQTPLPGAVVKAAHLATETVYESVRTGADGRFTLADLPGGTYELAVATEAGLYPTDQVLEVEPGQVAVLGIALAPAATEEDEKKKKGSFWDRPALAAGAVVGFSLAMGLAADKLLDDQEEISEVIASPH